MDIKEKVKGLPSSPGVYLMKDSLNNIIYVGKSKKLKNRVGSYFINSKAHSPKTLKLVKNLKDFDFVVTDTEFEAFILECKLIKDIKPAYNRLMKSPKSYKYVHINLNKEYPDFKIVDEITSGDGMLYFGPYVSKSSPGKAVEGIKEFYKILCSNDFKRKGSCLNYSLGLCVGLCVDDSKKDYYMDVINKVINLLEGKDSSILNEIEEAMRQASENFDFERAAKYRDYLTFINYLVVGIKAVDFTEENKNIILVEYLDNENIKIFFIKGNKVIFKEKDSPIKLTTLAQNIIKHYKKFNLNDGTFVGKNEVDEAQIIYNYINNKSNNLKFIVIPDEFISDAKYINREIKKLFE